MPADITIEAAFCRVPVARFSDPLPATSNLLATKCD